MFFMEDSEEGFWVWLKFVQGVTNLHAERVHVWETFTLKAWGVSESTVFYKLSEFRLNAVSYTDIFAWERTAACSSVHRIGKPSFLLRLQVPSVSSG